jgi:hypothetical protein
LEKKLVKSLTLKALLNIFIENKLILLIILVITSISQYLYSNNSYITYSLNFKYVFSENSMEEFVPTNDNIKIFSKIINNSVVKSKHLFPTSINWSADTQKEIIIDKNLADKELLLLTKNLSVNIKKVDFEKIKKELPNILKNLNLLFSKYKILIYEINEDKLKEIQYKYQFAITRDPEFNSQITQLILEELVGKTMWFKNFNKKINKFFDVKFIKITNFKEIIKDVIGIIVFSLSLTLLGHLLRKKIKFNL